MAAALNDNRPRRAPKRKRDPQTGFLRPRHCQMYFAGHSVHWIQALRSSDKAHRSGRLLDVDGQILTIAFGGEVKRYRNCDPKRLLEIVGTGNRVFICEPWSIMRAINDYCFSIADADHPWVPCDDSRITPASPDALASRPDTRGGSVVSLSEVVKHFDR